jgi:sensor histidine kinase YesM
MQAQIEPHFLFNTLANVRRLYQVDPGAARTMLRQFSLMLGRSLADIRNERATLGREVALTLAYLGVQKIRMGDRLEFATDIPPPLRDAALPPMMLSTLVENSIKHGLAPLRGGGRVTIVAEADGGTLRVRVVDTGCGLERECRKRRRPRQHPDAPGRVVWTRRRIQPRAQRAGRRNGDPRAAAALGAFGDA